MMIAGLALSLWLRLDALDMEGCHAGAALKNSRGAVKRWRWITNLAVSTPISNYQL